MSEELSAFIGKPSASAAEVLERLWQHAKANSLRDAVHVDNIHCDAQLKQLFGVDTVTIGALAELVHKHLTPIDAYVVQHSIRVNAPSTNLFDIPVGTVELPLRALDCAQLDAQMDEKLQQLERLRKREKLFARVANDPQAALKHIQRKQLRDRQVTALDVNLFQHNEVIASSIFNYLEKRLARRD